MVVSFFALVPRFLVVDFLVPSDDVVPPAFVPEDFAAVLVGLAAAFVPVDLALEDLPVGALASPADFLADDFAVD
ncbi:hypothetical protein HMPREF9622_00866 [Cutibacterium modestum HL037PA3]|uniref:Uncharacterized protein n=2 Tax=Cutibacterium modestum TaxID=2559073 RepID=A0AAD1KNR4_9ACTN|nr:hypothetical protein HMPREF9621_00481 [Cutibacterium modestum HL037PA2]EFS91672.1 hypothetical protein HMPREF9607_02179 [Cutibacterium modestum HL044PA1]EFT16006.1 hypothetical protein HMPREF9622_00866 [Cutibacterium modestum HL037PA3]BCY25258.1 hypothetical protein KB1_12480 [Cutibacterium modestum]